MGFLSAASLVDLTIELHFAVLGRGASTSGLRSGISPLYRKCVNFSASCASLRSCDIRGGGGGGRCHPALHQSCTRLRLLRAAGVWERCDRSNGQQSHGCNPRAK